jgi:hypothetical protein
MLRVAIREHRIKVPELFASRLEKATMTLRREAMARPDSLDFAVQAASRQTGIVIRTLGKRGDIHYFSSTMNMEIVALPSSAVSRPTSLFQLAPESYWMMTFGNNKGQVNYNSAASWLIQRCNEQEIFSPDKRIRGAGVWLDSGRVIHHLGSHLVVDGTFQSVRGFSDSKLFYEGTDSLLPDSLLEPGSADRLHTLKPLSDAEGAQIARAAELSEWEMDGMGMLVAGWIAVAILCASLKWRTHVWLTAPSQSGKSTLLEEFVLRLLHTHGLDLNGSTTESGLRQLLKRAALPVTIDEAEGETDQDRARIRSIMTSARSMTSGKGKTAKGTVGGTAVTFNPRSMLFLVSVAHDLSQAADTSRVVNLRLCKVADEEVADRLRTRWAEQASILKRWDDEFVVRFWLRMSGLLPRILANTELLKEIIKARGGVRMGDVYAPLLAGYHALTRTDLLSEAEAQEMVGKYFAVFKATGPESGAGSSDGGKVLTHLRHVPVVVDGRRIILAEAVSEVLRAQDAAEKSGKRRNEVVCPADEELRRMGMRVVQKTFKPRKAGATEKITVIGLAVATMAPAIDEVFAKTNWAAPRWRTVLKQIPGVESTSERILDGDLVSVTLIPVERVRAESFAAMNEAAAKEEEGSAGIDAQLQGALDMPDR